MKLAIPVDTLQVGNTSAVGSFSTLRLRQQDHDGLEIELWLSEADFLSLQKKIPTISESDTQRYLRHGEESNPVPWFFQRDEYSRLLHNEGNVLFWVKSVAGAGKQWFAKQVFSSPDCAYEAIDYSASQIRVLTLHAANDKRADIHCTLDKISLNTYFKGAPIYDTLSYVWGDANTKRIIYVNGSPFPITANLHIALRFLRMKSEARLLWVDAICINQYDLQEKNHQVRMMWNIYHNAARVLVWLGRSNRDIRKVMALFKRVEICDFIFPENEILGPYLRGLAKFFNKPWWSRMWVVQEVLAARKPPLIGCGRQWVSWNAVSTALSSLGWGEMIRRGDFQSSVLKFSFTDIVTSSAKQQALVGRLEDLLVATCDRQTTLPHDKVFALLGLTQDASLHDFILDYSQPYSFAFQKAMFHVLDKSSNLNFLIQVTNNSDAKTPTWCIDFRQPYWNRYTDSLRWNGLHFDKYASNNTVKSTLIHNLEKSSSTVYGSAIGRINITKVTHCSSLGLTTVIESEKYIRSLSSDKAFDMRKNLIDCVLSDAIILSLLLRVALDIRCGQTQASQRLTSGEVWKTMCEGKQFEELTVKVLGEFFREQIYRLPKDFSAVEKLVQEDEFGRLFAALRSEHGSEWPDLLGQYEWLMEVLYLLGLHLVNRTFFTTYNGYFGNAPTANKLIKEGDLLCILHGCSLPVVLRPRDQRYEVVTFTYVSDVMNREFFDGTESDSQGFVLI